MSQFILFFTKLVLDSIVEMIIKEHYSSVLSQIFFKRNWQYFFYAFHTRSVMEKNINDFGYKHRGLISLCTGGFAASADGTGTV